MMGRRGDAIAARARALVGTRFRPQGRARDVGLDCVGVIASSLGLRDTPADYALHGGSEDALCAGLKRAGLRRVGAARIGDVLVLRAGLQQLHLAVVTDAGFVHADAGLRRVVETPGIPPWPIIGIWRRQWRR